MTRKIYKSAMGKTIDIGALMLQNENVRAVGNMNVNARGDVLDSTNQVIDQKNKQIQRQHQKHRVKSANNPAPSAPAPATRTRREEVAMVDPQDTFADLDQHELETEPEIQQPASGGGLAAAIARSRAIKQELEKTPRQLAQQSPLKKI